MKVAIPSQLRDYTRGAPEVDATGSTVSEVLADLDRQFNGMRFRIIDEQDRIRPHVRIFLNHDQARRLDIPVNPSDRIMIVGALSGG